MVASPSKMLGCSLVSSVLLMMFGVYTKTVFAQGWERMADLPTSEETDLVAVHPIHPETLFIGGKGNLYASWDRGRGWKKLIGFGRRARTNQLHFDSGQIVLLTSEGLFQSQNGGEDWEKTFGGKDPLEQNVLAFSPSPSDPNTRYLGTEGGLFVSEDRGKTWRKEASELGRQPIWALRTDLEHGELFIGSERGLYLATPSMGRLDLIYSGQAQPHAEVLEKTEEAEPIEPHLHERIEAITLLTHPLPSVAIGTCRGVLISQDRGNRWERLPRNGLGGRCIHHLVHSPRTNTLFASTEKSIYVYDQWGKHWRQLHQGLPLTEIKQLELAHGSSEVLYAATRKGAYRMTLEPEIHLAPMAPETPQNSWPLALELFGKEPSVWAIQREAIRYANVSNWKTKSWHWGSKLRGILPSFSVGKGFSTSNNVDIDRAGAADPDVYILGPDDRNRSWQMNLQWDLADILWNSSQTSIDTREKLMVELRNDILGEATRLYFERRWAQIEFILKPPSNHLERSRALLRLEELTASLDAMTGGHLTRQLNKLYAQNPRFYVLWE